MLIVCQAERPETSGEAYVPIGAPFDSAQGDSRIHYNF